MISDNGGLVTYQVPKDEVLYLAYYRNDYVNLLTSWRAIYSHYGSSLSDNDTVILCFTINVDEDGPCIYSFAS